jgi:hypothetical protein
LRIESLMMTATGEKLNDAPGVFGAGLPQLTAQQSIAALTLLASQSFDFFLQHAIADIPFSALPEKTGVPASTPLASAKNRKSDVSHFFIFSFTIWNKLKYRKFIPFSDNTRFAPLTLDNINPSRETFQGFIDFAETTNAGRIANFATAQFFFDKSADLF